MGVSHSSDSHSSDDKKKRIKKLRSLGRTVEQYRKIGSKNKSLPVQKWKEQLGNLFSTEEVPYWQYFQNPLLAFLEAEESQNVSWLANLQITTLNFPTYHSQLSARQDAPVFDFDKFDSVVSGEEALKSTLESHEKNLDLHFPTATGPSFTNNLSYLNTTHASSPSKQEPSSKSILASKFMSMVQNERSVKQDLRLNLVNQFSNPAHIVTRLVTEFVNIFHKVFAEELKKLQQIKGKSVHDKASGNAIFDLIKHFTTSLRAFIEWIYDDLIQQVKKGLDQEDTYSGYIIESILYKMIFSEKESTLNKLVTLIIEIQTKKNFKKFEAKLQKLKHAELKEFDESLPNSIFLLPEAKQPYWKVIHRMRELRSKSSPFEKHEVVKLLEIEMMNSICEYYKESPNIIQKARDSFGMDLKIPLLTYCVVKSQNIGLLLDKILIEEFVHSDYLDTTPSFSAFATCLDFLVTEEEREEREEKCQDMNGSVL